MSLIHKTARVLVDELSSGEVTPGLMVLRDENSGDVLWEVEWDLLGRMELRPRGEALDEDA